MNINTSIFKGTDVEEYTESEFQEAYSGFFTFSQKAVDDFQTELDKLSKGDNISQENLDLIEKGKKDITKLVKKIIIDSKGRRRAVYVKMPDAEGSHEKPKFKHVSGKAGESFHKYGDKNSGIPSSEDVEAGLKDTQANESVHSEAWERHNHQVKVHRMGKEASIKAIESKYGKSAAAHVREKHEAPAKAAEEKIMGKPIKFNEFGAVIGSNIDSESKVYTGYTISSRKGSFDSRTDYWKNGKPVYAKDLNFNERHNNLTNHPDTKSKYNKDGSIITEPKKEEKISLMKPMAGKTYQVTKIGGQYTSRNEATGESKTTKSSIPPSFVLEATDGSHQVGMEFSSKDEAKKFATGRSFPIKSEPKKEVKSEVKDSNSVKLLQDKIKWISQKMVVYGDSGYGGNSISLQSNGKVLIGGNLVAPHSAQVSGDEVKVSFNANNNTMIIFSNKIKSEYEDRTSFEKYKGLIYSYKPMTEAVANDIMGNINELNNDKNKSVSLKEKYKGKKPTETFMSIYGTPISVYGKEGDTYHVKYGDADSIITHTKEQLDKARPKKKQIAIRTPHTSGKNDIYNK